MPQAKAQDSRQCQRQTNTDDGRRPAQPIEELPEHGGAGETADKVAGEIHAARRATVPRGGVADKTCSQRLREESARGHQHHTGQDERQAL